MTHSEIMENYNVLRATDFTEHKDGKLNYAVEKNRAKLEKEAKILDKAIQDLESVRFKTLRDELIPMVKARENTILEEENIPKLSDYRIEQIHNEIIAEWDKGEEFKTEADQFIVKRNGFLEEESTFEPYKIKLSYVESLPLTGKQMRALLFFIDDESNG